ncbi:MAG TPA: hypothetical protein VLF87_01430 [Patescibacteria group bacterium]|nr:hypothetical protein [Patescibacteria group bacterium]
MSTAAQAPHLLYNKASMEGTPFIPEYQPDNPENSSEKKKDSKKEKKLSAFEALIQPKEPEKLRDDKPEKKDKDDALTHLQELLTDEKQASQQEIIHDSQETLQEELSEVAPDSEEEKVVLTHALYLERLDEAAAEGPLSETDLDETLDEVLAETGLEDDDETEPEEDEKEPEAEESEKAEADSEEADDEEEEEDPTTPTTTTTTTPPPVTPPPPPPPKPTPPVPVPTPPPPPPPPTPPTPGPPGPGVPPPPGRRTTVHNVYPSAYAERRAARRGLLVGGILGYLVGRRRGRIKTEKRLLPIQHKLERQVLTLQDQIAEREERLRLLAAERLATKPIQTETIVEKLHERRQKKTPEARSERAKEPATKPERLGKLAMTLERPEAVIQTNTERPKPVELLSTPDLLAIAERIRIENANVKQLFETNRLDRRGLERVVRAFLQGERYERTIRENLKTPEMQAFPNPEVRDARGAALPLGLGGTAGPTEDPANSPTSPAERPLDALLAKAGFKEESQPLYAPVENNPKQRNATVTGLVVAVVVVAVIFVLFLLLG